jgi:hypothetical protein
LSLEEKNGEALISFKNISNDPLDISVEDLKERFVRGDRSRNTEGNGLGLSIAQSLTELQKGKLELSIDGDLFKAILHFPVIEEKPLTDGVPPSAQMAPDDTSPAPVAATKSLKRKIQQNFPRGLIRKKI